MSLFARHREFIILAREVERICTSSASWETKYEAVFNEDVSLRMRALCPSFDYYDPDTSYEEDVRAFQRAASEKADDLEDLLYSLL